MYSIYQGGWKGATQTVRVLYPTCQNWILKCADIFTHSYLTKSGRRKKVEKGKTMYIKNHFIKKCLNPKLVRAI